MASFSDLIVQIGSAIIAILFVGFVILKITSIIGVGAAQWFNDTINNLTSMITGTLVPIFGFVVAIVLISVGWGYAKNMFSSGGTGQAGY